MFSFMKGNEHAMIDWDDFQDFDFQEFNEEEDWIQHKRQQQEEERQRKI